MSGNIWPTETEKFDQKLIPKIIEKINTTLAKTGLTIYPIGSGANPVVGKKSGDLDLMIDADFLRNYFQVSNNKDAKIQLENLFSHAGFDTAKTGQIVHVKTNIDNSFQQVDIMVVENANAVQKFHIHNIPQNSSYKGVHKHLAIALLAKQKGFKWSPYKGLLNRENNQLISNDLSSIAKILFGQDSTKQDLDCFENIISKMSPEESFRFINNLAIENPKNFNAITES